MKILFFNEFTSIPGGTDQVVNSEISALKKIGAEVKLYSFRNKEYLDASIIKKSGILLKFLWKNWFYSEFQKLIDEFEPDIIHYHNIYPLFNRPIWVSVNPGKAKSVLHLHNFYSYCLNSFFYNEKDCKECLIMNSWKPGILKKCKDNSLIKTLLFLNWKKPLEWKSSLLKISALIAVSHFVQREYTNSGVDPKKIKVLYNPIDVPDIKKCERKNKFVLFIGNIRKEKGIEFFCKTAAANPEINFVAAGEGLLLDYYRDKYMKVTNLYFPGYIDKVKKKEFFMNAAFVVVPSCCKETFSMSAAEAMSYGVPVLHCCEGGIEEIVKNGITGRRTEIENLPKAASDFWDEVNGSNEYFQNCRDFVKEFNPQRHAANLIELYQSVINN